MGRRAVCGPIRPGAPATPRDTGPFPCARPRPPGPRARTRSARPRSGPQSRAPGSGADRPAERSREPSAALCAPRALDLGRSTSAGTPWYPARYPLVPRWYPVAVPRVPAGQRPGTPGTPSREQPIESNRAQPRPARPRPTGAEPMPRLLTGPFPGTIRSEFRSLSGANSEPFHKANRTELIHHSIDRSIQKRDD